MEKKKETTKDLLTNSFKTLILKYPFEKITVRMITDGVGVIRPTFYKYFQDKYEIPEYILEKNIKEKIQVLVDNNMEKNIFQLLCSCLLKDFELYRRLYLIEGSNSFEHLMFQYIHTLLLELLEKYPLRSPDHLKPFTRDTLARFYTSGITDSLKYHILHGTCLHPEEFMEAYDYLIHHSFLDLVDYEQGS